MTIDHTTTYEDHYRARIESYNKMAQSNDLHNYINLGLLNKNKKLTSRKSNTNIVIACGASEYFKKAKTPFICLSVEQKFDVYELNNDTDFIVLKFISDNNKPMVIDKEFKKLVINIPTSITYYMDNGISKLHNEQISLYDLFLKHIEPLFVDNITAGSKYNIKMEVYNTIQEEIQNNYLHNGVLSPDLIYQFIEFEKMIFEKKKELLLFRQLLSK